MMEPIEVFAFRYFDPLRKRWLDARYKAAREEIAQRYEQYEIVGEPEVRVGSDTPQHFDPFKGR